MMADSGARGSEKQIRQLMGMRGLMADTTGRTIELPVKSNFREGLDVLEYFISAHGARKGLSDTALRTADSGYLTRRLVDVSHDIIIREVDCCEDEEEKPGIYVSTFRDGDEIIERFQERITGRYAAVDVFDTEGRILVKKNQMITPQRAEKIVEFGVDEEGKPFTDPEKGEVRMDAKLKIRSILSCKCHLGVCSKCYGANMADGQMVQVGEAVGTIAAQSIGEPGTQLTMRTFHTGGVAGGDITQGLPRVEELFEARKPKGVAIISEIEGVVSIKDASESAKKVREVTVTNTDNAESKTYPIPYDSQIKVQEGQHVLKGDSLTEGPVYPNDILAVQGVDEVQNYLLREVQRVYRLQGVEINDKHIEIIVRQMLKKAQIEDGGDSQFLPGNYVDVLEIEDANETIEEDGGKKIEYSQKLLGVTKAALATNSFLSAASFQETTRVLTDAAIKGKTDELIGLKENVLVGKLIPAGTGMKRYRSVKLDSDDMYQNAAEEDEVYDDMDEEGEIEDMTEEAVTYSDSNIDEYTDGADEDPSEE